MNKYFQSVTFLIKLNEVFQEVISCTSQRREKFEEKVKNCSVIFLDCIFNHCDSVGFN